MRPGRVVAALLALAGVPVLALLALVLFAGLAPGPAALAGAGVLAAAGLLAILWDHDLASLRATLARAEAEHPQAANRPDDPRLPGMAELARAVERLARGISARTAQLDQLRQADAAIVERLPDPLLVLGGERTVLRANNAARASFGAEIAAVLRHPGLRGAIDRAAAQRAAQHAEISLAAPVARDVQATVVPLDPPLADGGTALVVLSDRSAERALARMRADFIANASHELRTPLASLIGFVETLRGPARDDPEARTRFLAIMAEQGARMNRLIDDLLSLSRIEMTEHQPPTETVDLAALVGRIAAGFEPRLAAHAVRLEQTIAADTRAIAGDADQLAQVLQNLLDNAIKYGGREKSVELTLAPAEPGAPWPSRPGMVITIADHGPGIARAHLPRLTERFYRVDAGRSRAIGGTGLGLAIVKHIVNRHRGQLQIESEEGKGTIVHVWLPRPTETRPPEIPPPEISPPGPLATGS